MDSERFSTLVNSHSRQLSFILTTSRALTKSLDSPISSTPSLNWRLLSSYNFHRHSRALNEFSDKHLISPYNIPSWPNTKVTRIKETITNMKCLDAYTNSPSYSSIIRNTWRPLMRICILTVGLKGLDSCEVSLHLNVIESSILSHLNYCKLYLPFCTFLRCNNCTKV